MTEKICSHAGLMNWSMHGFPKLLLYYAIIIRYSTNTTTKVCW